MKPLGNRLAIAIVLIFVSVAFFSTASLAADGEEAMVASGDLPATLQTAESSQCGDVEPSFLVSSPLFDSGSTSARCSCSASADCWNGSTLSCNDTTGPCQCTGVDSNCSSGQRGYVRCNGSTTYCPSCPNCVNQCQPCSVGQQDPCGQCICVANACGRVAAFVCL